MQRRDLAGAVPDGEDRIVPARRVVYVATELLVDDRERVLLAPLGCDEYPVLRRAAEQQQRVGVGAADAQLLEHGGEHLAERLAGLRAGLEAVVEDGDVDALAERGHLVRVVVAVQQRELVLVVLADLVLRVVDQHQVRLLAVLADAGTRDLVDREETHEEQELQAVADRLGRAGDRHRADVADLLGLHFKAGNRPDNPEKLGIHLESLLCCAP